jgi:hypothetical protein
MNNDLVQQILSRLDAIGNTVVSTGKYAFEQQVKLMYANAIGDIITDVLFGIVFLVAALLLNKAWKTFENKRPEIYTEEFIDNYRRHDSEYSAPWDRGDIRRLRTCLITILTLIIFLLTVVSIKEHIVNSLCPEAAVINKMITK